MARNIYTVIAFERFSGNQLAKIEKLFSIKEAEKTAKEYLRFTNVERTDIYRNGELFEFFGREYNASAIIKIKDGKVSTVKL
jgi:hypothetical protein